jgi:iron(III) transport system substrate-binding protein
VKLIIIYGARSAESTGDIFMPVKVVIGKVFLLGWLLSFLLAAPPVQGQQRQTGGSADWDSVVDAARKEGKVTVSLPASAEMKKQIEEQFKKRYGIEVETFTARGSSAVRRMADEFKAGVRTFDLHIGGSSSIVSGMLDEGILDPIEPWLTLPEVKDPKQWWGGHMWVDNAKRFVYMFQAYLSEVIWYNTDLVKPNEIRSMDDFLNPKWKGKIGYLDPRTPGAGDSTWAFMWKVKGEEYLKKLVAQDLYLGRDQRLLSENLARGRIAVMIGNSYYSYLPFLKAGLPIKTLPKLKEGNYGTGGSGNLAIIKSPARPNSTRVFVNWLLGREGQEIVSRALGQATRRLDVDTRFLKETGTIAAKDTMSVSDFLQIENQSEEKLDKVRDPASKFALTLLK